MSTRGKAVWKKKKGIRSTDQPCYNVPHEMIEKIYFAKFILP